MPIHEKDLQNSNYKSEKESDHFFFNHEGINFRAVFQYPSKIWFFYNLDIKMYHGSQSDSSGVVSESRAKDMLIRHDVGVKEAQEFRNKRPVVKDTKLLFIIFALMVTGSTP